jgi:hypothetical protein
MQYFRNEYQRDIEQLFRDGYRPTPEDAASARVCSSAYVRQWTLGAMLGGGAVFAGTRSVASLNSSRAKPILVMMGALGGGFVLGLGVQKQCFDTFLRTNSPLGATLRRRARELEPEVFASLPVELKTEGTEPFAAEEERKEEKRETRERRSDSWSDRNDSRARSRSSSRSDSRYDPRGVESRPNGRRVRESDDSDDDFFNSPPRTRFDDQDDDDDDDFDLPSQRRGEDDDVDRTDFRRRVDDFRKPIPNAWNRGDDKHQQRKFFDDEEEEEPPRNSSKAKRSF